jgi:hypothetical protein
LDVVKLNKNINLYFVVKWRQASVSFSQYDPFSSFEIHLAKLSFADNKCSSFTLKSNSWINVSNIFVMFARRKAEI